jgi:hypothetical protein
MNQDDPWVRLGQLLVARRVELGYRTRAAFARHHGLSHDRGISAIENAERKNFSPATIASLELQYEWEPGSIEAVLGGGDPRPRGTAVSDNRQTLKDYSDSELLLELARRLTEGQLTAAELQNLRMRDTLRGLPQPTAEEQEELHRKEVIILMDMIEQLGRYPEMTTEDLDAAKTKLQQVQTAFVERYGEAALAELVAGHNSVTAVDEALAKISRIRPHSSIEGHEPPLDAAADETGEASQYERDRERDHGADNEGR